MRKNENGFGAVEGLLILVIVGIVGFVGWYVLHSKQEADKLLTTAGSQTLTPAKATGSATEWVTFAEPKDPTTTFKYPKTWKLSDTEGVDMGDGNRNVAVTSPAGSKLVLTSTGAGLGGDCQETEHSTITYSQKIAGAANLYVVEWQLFDGKTSLAAGTDVLNGAGENAVFTKLGDHPGCVTMAFAFSSTKYTTAGYWFGTNQSKQALKSADKAMARQILGSLTVQ